ncbi:hypothetical protein H5410_044105 [Solanum commersonii]|uniref:Pectinesterase catalytic domain-containing protein n=1 Tax=Solanum commersonii TaxID=4109 RepID=A0A9J5Y162_SOLCO|nr:hypothetical protein H5410_044105 [Solanum commersonii]
MDALFACPNNSTSQYYIQIKQRIYEEYVQIDSWKTNIVFIGEGMDKTIISGNKSYGGGIGTYYTATVVYVVYISIIDLTIDLYRPWGKFSRIVIMQSYIDMFVNPRGWIEFETMPRVQPYYLEYQNKGVGADLKRRVKWTSTTNDPRIVSNFTVRNFINGNK